MALQFQRVRIEPLGCAREKFPQSLAPLLHSAPATLQDAQPSSPVGAREEREVPTEPGVLVGLRASLSHQLTEALLALRCDLVDDSAATAGQRWDSIIAGWSLSGLGDQACGLHSAQRRVERAEADRGPDRSELGGQLLAQLVPVHGALMQEAEDGELQRRHIRTSFRGSTGEPSGDSTYSWEM